ncbi:hypothetical protein J132_08576 [Termitomyces sp. J132]|nr:hypothetical protein J132_08576 [Termitomyces sp. J132]
MYQPPSTENTTTTTAPALYNPYIAAHSHYPSHYPSPAANLPHYFPPFPHAHPPKPSPVPEAPQPPDLTSITPSVASSALHRLISAELRAAGFDAAKKDAVRHIEVDVVAFVEQLFARAHEYANLANRAGIIATDVLLACNELGIGLDALRTTTVETRKRKKHGTQSFLYKRVGAPALLPAPPRSSSPDLLPSDDEGAPPTVPLTLRLLPSYFPSLPPKHTYLRTPASPPKKAALPSLEKKLKTAALVQESLRNLLVATEDSTNQEEGELLGHIVNWELSAHPRKRWKPSNR